MTTVEKIENFLMEMDLSYKELEDGIWIVEDDNNHTGNIIIKYDDPVVLFRVKVSTVPNSDKTEFFQKILELNASDMIYGAYGLEGNNIVIINTLAAENLDFNEFQSTIESISLSLMEHYEILQQYFKKEDA